MSSLGMTTEVRSRSELERLQVARLQALLAEVLQRNRFWQSRFAEAGLSATQIKSLADLQKLPLTTKADVLADQAAQPPYGTNLTYDVSAYSRLHQTSGTTGAPLRWLDTPASWDWILQTWRQLFGLMGLRRDDRLFFPFSFGPFLGFWAGFEGANRLGNLCIPAGGMSSPSRLALLQENQTTVVCCTPTYALRLAETAAEQNVDLTKTGVRAILVAGEPGGNIPATRRRIEAAWGAQVVDHWGMTELGPLAIESLDHPGGLYVLETECIAEIIDPQTCKSVSPGEEGELVITNLGRTGSPLIRYRTGDRVCAGVAHDVGAGSTGSDPTTTTPLPKGGRDEFPPFGRGGQGGSRDNVNPSSLQLRPHLLYLPGGILGRVDDMLTIRGNNLYPSALEEIVRRFDGVAEFRIELQTVKAMQHLRIEVEPAAALSGPAIAALTSQIAETIKARWHFQAEVLAVASGSLPRFEMKARRFVRS
ncbi:MAG: AMP-binding protein [Planctomycetia bacterium]|nr:AMP-binding protein [Planctomycetia bacterium]